MAATIVYVHGNGNKVRREVLKRQWDEALFGADMGTASRMAYWASLRYPQPLPDHTSEEAALLPNAPLEAAAPAPEPADSFIARTALEARQDVAPAGGAYERAAALEAAGGAVPLGGWLADMTYAADALAEGEAAAPPPTSPFEALPFPRQLRIAAFRALVKVTFKDVYAYFFGGFKDRMRQAVRDSLQGLDGPVVVLGHSLGSVIAYDVLREQASRSQEVPLFVTVGSPLGVTEIQDLVERPLQVPDPVKAWRNASDARDLVAMDHTVRPEYAPQERCTDLTVINDSGTHHDVGPYLRAVAVRQPVLELFRR